MTIGPEPITRTDSRSARLGIGVRQLRDETLEQVPGIMWPRGRLRVVLHAEGRPVDQGESLDHIVVEVAMRDHGGSELGIEAVTPGSALTLLLRKGDGEAVVVGR